MPRHALLQLAALASLAALPACDGCHASKPYTPYTLSDLPSASATDAGAAPSAGSAGAPDGGAAYPRVDAAKAPEDGKRWPLGGGVAEPPAGHAFAEGLVLDADGDGKPDLFAWSRAPDGLRGEIRFAPGKDPANGRTVVALPDLAVPGCAIETSLARIGPSMIAFDYDPRCTGRAQGKGAHWIALFRLVAGAPPELGFEVRVAPPAEGESIAVALDGRDRDGDGRGDLTATFTLTGAPRPFPAGAAGAEAHATIAFFDRPAGLSRDPTEPEASLKAVAAALVADGRKRTTAPHVPAAAVAARRLWALLCDESGHAAVTTTGGPVRCGDTRVIEDAVMAETEAALNLGDPIAAAAAMARLETRRRDLDTLFAKHVPMIPGRLARTTGATPYSTPAPAFSPVAFDRNGDILVRTKEGVVRVDHASFVESRVDPAPAWPTRLAFTPAAAGDAGAPAGAPAWTLTSVETRCDAPTLVARFEAASETFDTPLPILTPAHCSPARIPAEILGPSPQGDLIAVRGELVAIPHEAPPHPTLPESLALPAGTALPPGVARSPDGTVIAVTMANGVLVAQLKGQGRGATAKLWTNPALDGATACVPGDGGSGSPAR